MKDIPSLSFSVGIFGFQKIALIFRSQPLRGAHTYTKTKKSTMLATSVSIARRRISSCVRTQVVRAQSSQVDKSGTDASGPLGEDGRHEIWREGIYDHDNEPK